MMAYEVKVEVGNAFLYQDVTKTEQDAEMTEVEDSYQNSKNDSPTSPLCEDEVQYDFGELDVFKEEVKEIKDEDEERMEDENEFLTASADPLLTSTSEEIFTESKLFKSDDNSDNFITDRAHDSALPQAQDDEDPEMEQLSKEMRYFHRLPSIKPATILKKNNVRRHSHRCFHCPALFLKESLCLLHSLMAHKLNITFVQSSNEDIPDTEDVLWDKNGAGSFQWKMRTEKEGILCQLCNHRYPNIDQFLYHMRLHDTYKQTTCPICNFPCKSEDIVKTHLQRHEKDRQSNFRCLRCDYVGKNNHRKRSHLSIHALEDNLVMIKGSKNLFKCKLCSEKFTSKYSGIMHSTSVHKAKLVKGLTYFCKECASGFTTRNELKLHLDSHIDANEVLKGRIFFAPKE